MYTISIAPPNPHKKHPYTYLIKGPLNFTAHQSETHTDIHSYTPQMLTATARIGNKKIGG